VNLKRTIAILMSGSQRWPVLVYHNVGYARARVYPEQTVTPARFERQLELLKRLGYAGLRLQEWIDQRIAVHPLVSRPLLITFDDGYAELAEHAFPLLLKYGFPAAVFVVTDRLGKTNTWDEACGYETHGLLTREQIIYWAGRGIDFAAHGRTHADLSILPSAESEREVLESRDELAAILGRRPLAFAYPYGKFNPAVVETVRTAYPAAFTARRGLNTARTDSHLLRRALVDPRDSLLDLACRVRFGWSPIAAVRQFLRPPRVECPAAGSNPCSGGGAPHSQGFS
jgi:peptidoglycan/xylan/chitin deacetylase (PgdA/CDA1 family)